jgi:hypothetical protein
MCPPKARSAAPAAVIVLGAAAVASVLRLFLGEVEWLLAAGTVIAVVAVAAVVLAVRWWAHWAQLVHRSMPQNTRNIQHARSVREEFPARRPQIALSGRERLPAAPGRLAIEPAPPRILPGWTGADEDLGDPIVEERPALLAGAALAEEILRGARLP